MFGNGLSKVLRISKKWISANEIMHSTCPVTEHELLSNSDVTSLEFHSGLYDEI